MSVEPALAREMCRRMPLMRRCGERVHTLFAQGRIPGAAHLSIGRETEVAGACMAVAADDCMVGNHRSHGPPFSPLLENGMYPHAAQIVAAVAGLMG